MTPRVVALAWLGLLVAGSALRLVGVWIPLDHRSAAPWREADYAQIARNYARGEGSLLSPRVDWRGDSSGATEMELPVLPFLGGWLQKAIGGDERWMRALSALASVASLLLFALLARSELEPLGAWIATALFAANPIAVSVANSLQPESLLVACLVGAFGLLARWQRTDRDRHLWLASAALALAILVKATAAHLGLVFAWAVWRRYGTGLLARPAVWLAGATSLLPPLAWYTLARGNYLETGLSLGVSNEAHWLVWANFTGSWAWTVALARIELIHVLAGAGPLLLLVGALGRERPPARSILVWYVSALGFLVMIANTAADDWARYYHLIAVPSASLLMGAGAGSLIGRHRIGQVVALVSLAACLVVTASSLRTLEWRRFERGLLAGEFTCTTEAAAHVPADALIVLEGGPARDGLGREVAYHRSMAFWWMDRRGFAYPLGDLTPEGLERLRARGADFWWSRAVELERSPGLRGWVPPYPEVTSCGPWRLFDLRVPVAEPAAP